MLGMLDFLPFDYSSEPPRTRKRAHGPTWDGRGASAFGDLAVLGLEALDQAVDSAFSDFGSKRAAVVGHEAQVLDHDVLHLPAGSRTAHVVVDRYRGPARLLHHGVHDDFLLVRLHPCRFDFDRLIALGRLGEG